MDPALTLASSSQTRQLLLRNAAIPFVVDVPRVDEETVRRALEAEDASPRDIADTLAEMKARKVAERAQTPLTMGCDQVLCLGPKVFGKPQTQETACEQLAELSGQTHKLLSAVVVYEGPEPVWRFVGEVRLQMRELSPAYVAAYVDRNWSSIQHSVGAYKLEEEGSRLFSRITGDYFTVLGLPLLEVSSFLTQRGYLEI